jgi:FKBP-type peptidyl-prolyl cis-trans isomerase SlyD
MTIEQNTVVTLHYRLQADNAQGELIEETFGSDPLVFLYGAGQMIPEFERQLAGKNEGDQFAFGIASGDAYGEFDADAVAMFPLESFVIDGKLATEMLSIGNRIPMSDNEGNRLVGVVTEVSQEGVMLDFNHPMAGQDLFFSVAIESIREATPGEIEHGHVHGPGGHHH